MTSTSHSEVESFLLCRRKHYYGYARRLQRVSESASLAMGTAVHAVLEAFYGRILEAGNDLKLQQDAFDDAFEVAEAEYLAIINEGYEDKDLKRTTLYDLLFNWYFPNEPLVKKGWRIYAVEAEFNLMYDEENDLSYPFKIDLIARDPEGKTVVIDHKCVWDFYSYEASELQPQIPKYIGALRALNYKVDYGMYNQLRSRRILGDKMLKADLVAALEAKKIDTKGTVADLQERAEKAGISVYSGPELTDMLYQLPLKPNSTRVQTTFLEQIEAARQLSVVKALPLEEQSVMAVRVANKMVCQSCSFRDLCISELNGENTKLLLKTEFRERDKRAAFDLSQEADDVTVMG